MQASTTYYDILNITSNASAEDIKSAFRKMALEYHPDKHNNSPQSHAQFIILNNAYNILADCVKRQEYDFYIKGSSTYKAQAQLGTPAIPGRPGETYRSNEELLSHFNFLLWDIDDLIRNWKSILWEKPEDQVSPQYYILKILTFIDKWVLEPGGFGDYFMEARKLKKLDPSDYMNTFDPYKTGHQPFVNFTDYFYNIRGRMDKFLRDITLDDLVSNINGYDIPLLGCIIEAQNHTVHYLSYLLQLQKKGMAPIPTFEYSDSCFQD